MPEPPFMGEIIENPRLRDQRFVFTDRHDAGRQLGSLILSLPRVTNPLVLAIPAGGVPVGKEVALALGAPFMLAVVRKIQIPGNTEAGFGAITWDDQVLINDELLGILGLSPSQLDAALARTRENVRERLNRFTGGRAMPSFEKKTVIITDDGLASGFTMLAALQSVRTRKPDRIIVAVPTASGSSTALVSRDADLVVCLNIRNNRRFAVAEAYRHWYDLDDREVLEEMSGIT
jgi:predicted phosphoribosyltransferase